MHSGRDLSLSQSYRNKDTGLKITPSSIDLSLSNTTVYKAFVMLSCLKISILPGMCSMAILTPYPFKSCNGLWGEVYLLGNKEKHWLIEELCPSG